jgi:acyl-CoA thioester hydrolase
MSFHITNQIIKKEWTDYNKHMNVAYYVLVFDESWEVMLQKFKMGEDSAKTTGMSTMVVETYITYDNEVKEGEEVEVFLTYFDHDKKRLHYKLEMIEKSSKKLSATIELLSLYVDLKKRKVSEFEEEKINLMQSFINANGEKFNKDHLKFLSKLKK